MQGRSPTCYSPVRHSSTPKGLSVRLACVKHAASVRPEPGSNSPNKNNPSTDRWNSNQKNPITNKRHQTNWHQKNNNHTPQTGKHGVQPKKQQTKTTKHTIEFSNNTPFSGNPTNLLPFGRAVKLLLWALLAPLAADLEYISGPILILQNGCIWTVFHPKRVAQPSVVTLSATRPPPWRGPSSRCRR